MASDLSASWRLAWLFALFSAPCLLTELRASVSVFSERNRAKRRYLLRDLLRGIGLHDCEVWSGESEICRAGGNPPKGEKLLSSGRAPLRKPQLWP